MDADALAANLIRDEGLRLKPYLDSLGIETLGVGRNLRDVGITEDEARFLLKNDIIRVAADLDRECPWWRQQPDHVQLAMANMCFQLGIHGLLGFKRALAALMGRDYPGARREFLASAWAAQTPERATRVVNEMRP